MILSDGKRLVDLDIYTTDGFIVNVGHGELLRRGLLKQYNNQHEAYMVEDVDQCIKVAEELHNANTDGALPRYNYHIKELQIPAITADGWYARENMIVFTDDEEYFELTRIAKDHNEAYEVIFNEYETDYDFGDKVVFTDEQIAQMQCY